MEFERPPVSDSSGWKRELVKLAAVALTAAGCLFLIVNSTTLWNMLLSVAAIATVSWICEWKHVVNRYPLRNKAVLITGCDEGYGYELALALSDQGVVVYAGCRYSNGEGAIKLMKQRRPAYMHVLQMDVGNVEEIAEAEKYIRKQQKEKGLWGVVNCADLSIIKADVELTTMEQFENIHKVNYVGMVRVVKMFLPLVRQSKGRIVNVTSSEALVFQPFCAAYCSAKYASDAFFDILRVEMKKFGVTVCKVNVEGQVHNENPRVIGEYYDQIWDDLSEEQQNTYGQEYVNSHQRRTISQTTASDECSQKRTQISDTIEEALFDLKPRTNYSVAVGEAGIFWKKLRVFHKPFVPDWVMDRWLLRDTRHLPMETEQKT